MRRDPNESLAMPNLKQESCFEENPGLISPQSFDSLELPSPSSSSILSSTPSPSVRIYSQSGPKYPLADSSAFNNEVQTSMPIRCGSNEFRDAKVCLSPNSCFYQQPIVPMTPAFEEQSDLRKPLQHQ